ASAQQLYFELRGIYRDSRQQHHARLVRRATGCTAAEPLELPEATRRAECRGCGRPIATGVVVGSGARARSVPGPYQLGRRGPNECAWACRRQLELACDG